MTEQSSLHVYLNWTKERLDEMDATLASLESKVSEVKVESKAKADQLVSGMKKRRAEFEAAVEQQAKAGEAALQRAQTQLETQWKGFEADVKTYFETVGKQIERQQETFRNVAAAQAKAWREAIDQLYAEANKVAAARRAEIDAEVQKMKADATEAEARLQKLKQAGSESWTALGAALAETRGAFDRANQKVCDAIKRAAAA